MSKNVEINIKNESGYEVLYPKTITDIIETDNGDGLQDYLENQRYTKVGDVLYTVRPVEEFTTEWMECNGQKVPGNYLINEYLDNDLKWNRGTESDIIDFTSYRMKYEGKYFDTNGTEVVCCIDLSDTGWPSSSENLNLYRTTDLVNWARYLVLNSNYSGYEGNVVYLNNSWFLIYSGGNNRYYCKEIDFSDLAPTNMGMKLAYSSEYSNFLVQKIDNKIVVLLYNEYDGYAYAGFNVLISEDGKSWSESGVTKVLGRETGFRAISRIQKINNVYCFFAVSGTNLYKCTCISSNLLDWDYAEIYSSLPQEATLDYCIQVSETETNCYIFLYSCIVILNKNLVMSKLITPNYCNLKFPNFSDYQNNYFTAVYSGIVYSGKDINNLEQKKTMSDIYQPEYAYGRKINYNNEETYIFIYETNSSNNYGVKSLSVKNENYLPNLAQEECNVMIKVN